MHAARVKVLDLPNSEIPGASFINAEMQTWGAKRLVRRGDNRKKIIK
jgi:hypothetical protein